MLGEHATSTSFRTCSCTVARPRQPADDALTLEYRPMLAELSGFVPSADSDVKPEAGRIGDLHSRWRGSPAEMPASRSQQRPVGVFRRQARRWPGGCSPRSPDTQPMIQAGRVFPGTGFRVRPPGSWRLFFLGSMPAFAQPPVTHVADSSPQKGARQSAFKFGLRPSGWKLEGRSYL